MSKNFEYMQSQKRGYVEALEPVSTTSQWKTFPSKVRVLEPRNRGNEWLGAMGVLRKHWRWAVGFAFLVTVVVTALAFLTKPVYEPSARIEVDPPGSEQFSLVSGEGRYDAGEYAETQSKTLQGDQLAVSVIRKLHLAENPLFVDKPPKNLANTQSDSEGMNLSGAETVALRNLKKDLKVQRDTSSWLITVSFASTDPRLAATVTNTVVQEFLDSHFQARHLAILQSTEWLSRQLDDIKERMEQSNAALTKFQKDSGITPVGTDNSFEQEVAELYRQLATAQGERIQLESLMTNVNAKPSALPQANSDPVVQELSKKLATARADLTQARVTYGPNHPKVKESEAQIRQLEREVQDQQNTLYKNLQTSYAAAHGREQLLGAELGGAKKQVTQMAEYQNLKKQADANAELYNTLFTKVKEAGIAAESRPNDIRWVDRARIPELPARPRKALQIALGMLAGSIGGILLAFVRGSLDNRIHTLDDMRATTGLGRVSVVPQFVPEAGRGMGTGWLPGKRNGNSHTPLLPLINEPRSVAAEALRGLFTSVHLSQPAGPPHVLVVASAAPGEGKTTIAVSLAISLSRMGRTCIVDCDVRKSDVARAFSLTNYRGVLEILAGKCTLEQAVLPVENVPNLAVLPPGQLAVEPGEVITTGAMRELLRNLRSRYEFVVLDTPPILPFAEGRAISSLADGVIFVTRSGVTTTDAIQRGLELLEEVRSAPVLELVLNGVEVNSHDYKYQYGTQR